MDLDDSTVKDMAANPFRVVVSTVILGLKASTFIYILGVLIRADISSRGHSVTLKGIYEHLTLGALAGTALGLGGILAANSIIKRHRGKHD